MTTKEKIEVMAAYDSGKNIERRVRTPAAQWVPVMSEGCAWNWAQYEYRLASPAPEKPFALPEGVFWVRFASRPHISRLSAYVNTEEKVVGLFSLSSDHLYPVTFENLRKKYHWSHDRKAWFTFTGEAVAE